MHPAASVSLFYRLTRWVVRGVLKVYFRWRVLDAHRVPPEGPVILASNHQSFLDPPLVAAALDRRVSFLARRSLFESWWLGPFFRALRVIPLDREGGTGAGLQAVLAWLEAGGAVVLFPEGTRSPDGRLQRARPGVGWVVIRSGAPVVPVRVFGAFEAWRRGQRFPKPRRLTVKYGWPLRFDAWRTQASVADKAHLRDLYQQVADEIMNAIAALEPEADPVGSLGRVPAQASSVAEQLSPPDQPVGPAEMQCRSAAASTPRR